MPFTPFDISSAEDPMLALLRGMQLFDEIDEHHLLPLGLSVSAVLAGVREIDAERAMAPDTIGEESHTGRGTAAGPTPSTGYMVGVKARAYATSWWAHGLSIEQVATLIGRHAEEHAQLVAEIDAYLTSRTAVRTERSIMELHRAGANPADIARRLAMPRSTVDKAFARLGLTPKLKQPRVITETRIGVIADRNRGMTYPDLRRKWNLTTNQVRSILRHANNAGLIRNYGEASDAS